MVLAYFSSPEINSAKFGWFFNKSHLASYAKKYILLFAQGLGKVVPGRIMEEEEDGRLVMKG